MRLPQPVEKRPSSESNDGGGIKINMQIKLSVPLLGAVQAIGLPVVMTVCAPHGSRRSVRCFGYEYGLAAVLAQAALQSAVISRLCFHAASSGRFSSPRIRQRMMAERMAANTEVPAKFSQIPVSPSGHSAQISSTGKTRAVETEIKEEGRGFSIAIR